MAEEEEKVTQSSDTVEEKVTQPDEENSIVIDSEDTTPEEETKETEIPDTKEEEPTEKKENEVNQDNPEEVSTALKGKGIDYDALTQEYMTTGSLSSASMKKLQEVVEEMFNPKTSFEPTQDEKRCNNCPYRKLCY